MIDAANPAVQKHLELLQSIIDRMSSNSNGCKTWCITVISAMLALSYQQNNMQISYLSFMPLILFCFLDSYYLAIERELRHNFSDFVVALHNGTLDNKQLYQIEIQPGLVHRAVQTLKATFSSAAILPFYGFFFCLLVVSLWII